MSLLFGAMAVCLFIAGCGNDKQADTSPVAASLSAIRGNTYVSTDVPNDLTILTFADNTFFVDGCNDFRGKYSIKDGQLQSSETVSTLAACMGLGSKDGEEQISRILNHPSKAEFEGEHLVISGIDGLSMTFTRASPGQAKKAKKSQQKALVREAKAQTN